MEKEDREIIKHMSNTLDEMLIILKTPANRFMRGLEIAGGIVSIFAIVGIIDIIIKWILGG